MTQYTTGYNYPTTVKPEILQACEEDTNCPASEVCSTGGYCRKWENGERWYFHDLKKKNAINLNVSYNNVFPYVCSQRRNAQDNVCKT
jgi:hypothetical protein